MKNFCSKCCQFKHLIVCDFFHFLCVWNHTRICCVYTLYIGVDLAGICMQGCCQCNSSGIRTSTSQSCDIVVFINTLKTSNDNDLTLLQLIENTLGIDTFEFCIAICRSCMHNYLKCIQGYRRNTKCLHCHRHQCNRSLLTGCQKHIHLSFGSFRINVMCHLDQMICCLSHCGQNNNHVISCFIIFDTSFCYIKNSFFISYRTAAEFLYY